MPGLDNRSTDCGWLRVLLVIGEISLACWVLYAAVHGVIQALHPVLHMTGM